MSRTVFCEKLKQDLPALTDSPYPGEIGQKILNHISEQAWQSWLERQTMIINEYRLSMLDPDARKMLEKEMLGFLFEGKDEKPAGYTE